MMSLLEELAADIHKKAAQIQMFLTEHHLPDLSFSIDGPPRFPVPHTENEIHLARLKLLESANKIYDLVLGPVDKIIETALVRKYDIAVLRVIYDFSIAQNVPMNGEIAITELANRVGMSERHIALFLRHAITNGVFHEPHTGYIAHTGASISLVRDPYVLNIVGMNMCDKYPASVVFSERIRKFGDSEASNETAFNVANNSDEDIWTYFERDENNKRRQTFHGAMRGNATGSMLGTTHIARGFDWASLGEATVVDIGGSYGHISIALASQFTSLKFIIQDRKENIVQGSASLPADLTDRISFLEHDFFTPQPIIAAKVYFLRLIMMDWNDEKCRKILGNIVPAMTKESRIYIVDSVLQPPGSWSWLEERTIRSLDFQSWCISNARERDMMQWEQLFRSVEVDGRRLRLVSTVKPDGGAQTMFELAIA